MEGSKVIIEGLNPFIAEWISPNEIKVELKELPKPGLKKITIVPQTGSIIELDKAIEFE